MLAGVVAAIFLKHLFAPRDVFPPRAEPAGQAAPAAPPAQPARGAFERGAALFRRLAETIQKKAKDRGLVVELLRFLGGEDPPQAPAEVPAPVRREPKGGPAKLPEVSNEPPAQRAAGLWQGGVLAMKQGDYAWAIRNFESCLEAAPDHEGCRSGLGEARRRRDWNRNPRRKTPGPEGSAPR